MITVSPGVTFEAWAQFATGATVGVRIRDGAGADFLARTTTGVVEDVAGSGLFRKSDFTAPTTNGQYQLIWDDGTNFASEELLITYSSTVPVGGTGDTYASVSELARILKIRSPTAEQTDAMERVLLVATGEIDTEIDLAATADALAGWQLALVAEVNLERAVEHWRQQESPFGLLAVGVDVPAERTARDSWERHAMKLAPLKSMWGIA